MRTRWCLFVALVTFLGGCSSGSVKTTAPEPPPATGVPAPVIAEPAPAALPADAVAAVGAVAAPEVVAPLNPPAAVDPAAAAEDDPVLEGTTARPPAATRPGANQPAVATAAAAPHPVQAASARPAGKPAATGRIEIPSIGLNHATFEGIDLPTLAYGPGHWPGTPLPGNRGNTVFPGHRTTNTRPFWDIDKIAIGNEVTFTTPAGRFTYRVTETLIVSSRDTWVVNQTPDATFTILACHPKGSAKQRYVVKGKLVSSSAGSSSSGSGSSAAPGSSSGSGMPVLTTTTTRRAGFLGLF